MKPLLGYWNIRGLASPIRLLLSQANVDFDEIHYECGPPPHFDHSAYLKERDEGSLKQQLHFPNLPYYMDDEVKLTQSLVILRHLARKHHLDGRSETERSLADLVATQVHEWAVDFGRGFAWDRAYKSRLPEQLKTLDERLGQLASQLGDKKFVVSDAGPTYADFFMFEYLENLAAFQPNLLAKYPQLGAFRERVTQLEGVKRYFGSPKAIKGPFLGAPAVINGPYSHLIPLKE